MREECAARLREIGLTRVMSVDRAARELSAGERQSLAVMRAVYFGASLLLLDEPTVSLSARETGNVLAAIVEARNRRLGILYIDHNVSHVLRIADRIVVLEHGRVTNQLKASDVTENDVNTLLVRHGEADHAGESRSASGVRAGEVGSVHRDFEG